MDDSLQDRDNNIRSMPRILEMTGGNEQSGFFEESISRFDAT
jgi:hypothetical protein